MTRRPRTAVVLTVLVVVASAARAAGQDFAAAVHYGAGTTPTAVAVGDFNGDGRPDLATANAASNDVSILLGNADGTFAAGASYTTGAGASPRSVTAGDFDGDGKVDLAVANFAHNNVAVLLGDGFGGFGSASFYSTDNGPRHVAAADFDRNGALDLAVANASSNTVSILLGNGLGGFGAASPFATGTYPQSTAIGDFDGNATLDLVVANHDSNDVSFLAGNGSGSFGTAVSFAIPATAPALVSAPTSVTSGDFDGDGKRDLAVTAEPSRTVVVLLGNGAGGFGVATSFDVGTDPHAIVAGDFGGDGKVDLAVANYNASTVSLLVGNGSGGFAAAVNYATGTRPTALAMGDFNRDGKPDLASANYDGNNISILLNISACFANCGTFGSANTFGGSLGGTSVAAGDFDRNGISDLAVANGASNNVSILLGSGGGSFGVATNHAVGTLPLWVAVADFNRDGKLDLAVANETSDNVSILLGDGIGGFGSATSFAVGTSPSGPQSLAVGDFNRDGGPDLAVTCATSKEVSILINTAAPGAGAPSFSSSTITSVGSGTGLGPRGIATGDFGGDGKLDLAVADYGDGVGTSNVVILMGNGSGGFTPGSSVAVQVGPQAVGIGDFDGDGDLDLAVPNFGSGSVSILPGNGSGGFGSAVNVSAGTNPFAVAIADVNNDGTLDLAVVNRGGDNLSILLGNGSGAFTAASPATHAVGTTPTSVAAADLDGDGKPDLAVANNGGAHVSILLNTCPPPDLTVTKTHIGDFAQGQLGASYTIGVSNIAGVPTGGLVTVADTLPVGLTATGISGTGWSCVLGTLTCTRSDVLAPSGSYAAVTLTVNVAGNAAASVTNSVVVSGGGQSNTANDGASDQTTITQLPDLTIAKTHSGNFTQGQTGASYTVTVSNIGGAASSGTVSVTDSPPTGLTATAISGTGWSCILGSLTCTRNDVLASGDNYPAITLTVNVAGDAPALVTNTVAVSGGGESATGNNSAGDPTTVIPIADLTVVKTHAGNFTQGQVGAAYTITVTNVGSAASSGAVSVTDSLPAGLTATAIGGTGWGCTLGTGTCTRNDALGSAASYPDITLTVNVASNALALVTNTVDVSGGGEIATGNNSASDPTTVILVADLAIVKTHSGNFTQGQMFRNYTLTVSNLGPGPTSGTVTVTDTLPAGLTLNSIGGAGWTCAPAAARCTRNNVLAASESYPAITVNVNVAGNAPAALTNTATVSGGGELNTVNDIASDLTVVTPSIANCGTFAPAVQYPGFDSPGFGYPDSLAIGDFNGDGHGDLAVTHAYPGRVSILLGSANGTFVAGASNVSTDSPYVHVLVADFNGNGNVDLAVTDRGGRIFILLGNGDGTFAAGVPYPVGAQAVATTAGDFNGDGRLDLAAVDNGVSNVRILIGNGDGTFQAAVNYQTNTGPTDVGVGDFNGDGKADLALSTIGGFEGSVSILLGNGDGTFADKTDFDTGAFGAYAIEVADLNNDGKLDLAVGHASQNVSILRGNGNGTFASAVQYPAGGEVRWIAVVDLDGDGKLDLAAANTTASGGVSILRGIGDGSFGAPVSYPTGPGTTSVAAGDFNGDGKPDLTVWNDSGDVSVLLSACADLAMTKIHSGTFTQGQTGASYTLTVGNAGLVATGGTVTVTDALPAGLTATAIAGSGWSCALGSLTCTRSSVLAAAASYPPITVTVNVHSNAPALVTNSASVSGTGDANAANNTASDPTTVESAGLIAPTRLVATATSASQVGLVWDPVGIALSYHVYRSSNNGPFALVGTPASNAFTDPGRAGNTTYLYRVHAVIGADAVSSPSNTDLATTAVFTDDPVVAGSTAIKAAHLTELRAAVDAVRAAAGLPNAVYTNVVNVGAIIRAADVTELRSSLAAARSALGLPAMVYVDPALTTGTTVGAAHVQEIRNGTK